ncbi:MAG: response regulator [Balneolaceae bacterium]
MIYTILVIDDDEPIHYMAKSLLGKEFNLLHARDGQQAINILSENVVNLILSDIHMPGISGLELLESIRDDKEKRQIPILIMTNLPTIEKERKAFDLGAADFIKKEQFNNDSEGVLEIIRMKMVTDIDIKGLNEDLTKKKDKLVMKLMGQAISGSFESTCDIFFEEVESIVNLDFTGFWVVENGTPRNVLLKGKAVPSSEELSDFESSLTFQHLFNKRSSFLSNHIYNEDLGCFLSYSKQNKLPSEIGVPLYSVNERALLMNNMAVPKDADLFGVLVLKRSVLFSSTEFDLISRLTTQAGSILWRLYKRNQT